MLFHVSFPNFSQIINNYNINNDSGILTIFFNFTFILKTFLSPFLHHYPIYAAFHSAFILSFLLIHFLPISHIYFFCCPFASTHLLIDALASDRLCRNSVEENRPSEQQEEESNVHHDLSQLQLPGDEDEDEDEEDLKG